MTDKTGGKKNTKNLQKSESYEIIRTNNIHPTGKDVKIKGKMEIVKGRTYNMSVTG